jgi:hypothetical protein
MIQKIYAFFASLRPRRYAYIVRREVGGKKTLMAIDGHVPLDPDNIEDGWKHSAKIDDYGRLTLWWHIGSGIQTLNFTRVETANLFEMLFEARNDGLNKFGFHDSADEDQ